MGNNCTTWRFPPIHASPDIKAEGMNIKPPSYVLPDKLKAKVMNIKPPSYGSPVKSKTMNFIIKPSNHTTELTSSGKCTRKHKLIYSNSDIQ